MSKVPTEAGWWWRGVGNGFRPVVVWEDTAAFRWVLGSDYYRPVTDDGRWLAPCVTPSEWAATQEELRALRARLAAGAPVGPSAELNQAIAHSDARMAALETPDADR